MQIQQLTPHFILFTPIDNHYYPFLSRVDLFRGAVAQIWVAGFGVQGLGYWFWGGGTLLFP